MICFIDIAGSWNVMNDEAPFTPGKTSWLQCVRSTYQILIIHFAIPTKAWLGYHWCQLPRSMSRCWIIWYWISNGRGYHLEAQLQVGGWMATWLPARWKVNSLRVFLFFCWCPGVANTPWYNLICHREQSKWSKDLCISAVAVVVSLIISMFFSYFHLVIDWI